MGTTEDRRRLPRSIRIHLRKQKALLRRTLPPPEAERAIEQLVRSFRRTGSSPAAQGMPRTAATEDRGASEG